MYYLSWTSYICVTVYIISSLSEDDSERRQDMLLNIILFLGINAALIQVHAQFFMVGCIALGTFGSRIPLLGRQTTISVMDAEFCQKTCLAVNTNFAAVYNGCVD